MEGKSYTKVMIATDGSKHARKAIDAGIQFAKLTGAKLYAVYVIVSAGYTPRDFGWEASLREFLESEAKKAVNFVVDAGRAAGIEVEPLILEGHPADKILEFSEQESMDLIVMGTLGRTGLDRFLLGSVAEKVIRHSKIPVMVVKGEAEK
ncbi:MAG: universal stress protein [Methanosarcina thermophila]|uniref:Universal stress protein n=3 Tax=Methanosarcina thermophila TaxID=2210 RepID=A0A1I6Z9I3_METTE|nr:universal stress protein [Methanosarcina thermophila]AKB11882.1 Universal stress protein [Methanosarcina thermophila TM-1]SFT59362.1 Nucleotide-binding universal stress protein, UspA family [Methanosarcina thermophila]BAW29521.1 universal stress protein [Methanosarcina thermophila]GLI14021.1 universal stress protein [Methanosarcina thermophila MST-A1]HOA69776.1 universal stress protein [Methanosarcina thermophila]